MELLDKYLDTILPPKPKKTDYSPCCLDEGNIVLSDMLVDTCIECGRMMIEKPYNIDDNENFKNPLVIKTYTNYHQKYRNIHRLHKWSNWSYAEVELRKLQDIIDGLDIIQDIKRLAKIKLKYYYIEKKIVSRNKIRMGLLCYCIYTSYLRENIDININVIFEMLDINFNNYNQLVKKLPIEDQLYYPKDLDKYIGKFVKINTNKIMVLYTKLIHNTDIKYNKKTLLLTTIYYLLDEKDKKKFYKKIHISKNSINKVIDKMDII